MKGYEQPESPTIRLEENAEGEVTLYIEEEQAMQAWEKELMWRSADLLCSYGSRFIEVGLGLGLSGLRVAEHPNTKEHTIVEKYQQVIDLFRERHPILPATLDIVRADFFQYVETLPTASFDGIMFDPYMPQQIWDDPAFWQHVMPKILRIIRVGGAFVPFFSKDSAWNWRFAPFFRQAVIERQSYVAYPTTNYVGVGKFTQGMVFLQCFIKTQEL
jgi:spermidine synthase